MLKSWNDDLPLVPFRSPDAKKDFPWCPRNSTWSWAIFVEMAAWPNRSGSNGILLPGPIGQLELWGTQLFHVWVVGMLLLPNLTAFDVHDHPGISLQAHPKKVAPDQIGGSASELTCDMAYHSDTCQSRWNSNGPQERPAKGYFRKTETISLSGAFGWMACDPKTWNMKLPLGMI